MQYTDLTRKELQREYSRLTRKYTDFIRQPVELDLTTEDPLPGCANRRAVKHFGTVLDKELRDTGAARPAGRRGGPGHDARLCPPHGGAVPQGGCPL